jgi:YidC/Oxa1 family membrane protein insertase
MEKRILLAVVLSLLVLIVYQAFVPQAPPEQMRKPGTAQSGTANPETPPGTTEPPAVPEAGAQGAAVAEAGTPLTADQSSRDIVVETDAVRAVFTNRGAELKSWSLKRYKDARGTAVELIPDRPADQPRPFSLGFDDKAVEGRLRNALFKANAPERNGNGPKTVVFEYRDGEVSARKQFEIGAGGQPYLLRFTADVERDGRKLNPVVMGGPGVGDSIGAVASSYSQTPQGIHSAAGDTVRLNADALTKEPVYEGAYDFAGVDDQYFLNAALRQNRPADAAAGATSPSIRVSYKVLEVPIAGSDKPFHLVAYSVKYPEPPAGARFFLGPKDFDLLKAADGELVRAIHFGRLSFIVVPLLIWLKWVNTFVGNYGWSIIILTIIINAVMSPLRHKSVVSMRKMQELQPEVKAIQDRYSKLKATDPARQKMNAEMMNLYRERGVNPASGCIPILLTMPVLFAFYSLLSVAIEIRGAPFILWIHDLSRHDPLYVTPVLMGGTMVWQQMTTPATADPVQQRLMMFMPIMFTFMFLWAPSGLVLYWLVSNIWTIGQQYITNRIIGPPVVRTVRPAAERRIKKSGDKPTE